MTVDRMKQAIKDAERFIMRAKACLKDLSPDDYAIRTSKESGAARRASMDLTRALAELRKYS